MTHMGDTRVAYIVLAGRLDGNDHLEDPEVDKRMTLK